MQTLTVSLLAAMALFFQGATPAAKQILNRYVQAIGGEAAIRGVRTRITEGEYSNGHGLNTRYRIVEESPNRRVTIIGTDAVSSAMGSGRGFDGAAGWDKNFIGTGLRVLEGRELADAARDADMLRPLHLFDDCESTSVENSGNEDVVACNASTGARVRSHFDKKSGLLTKQDVENGARGAIHVSYEDYRVVDALRLPFKTHIDVPGATIEYRANSIKQNQPVDGGVFQKPALDVLRASTTPTDLNGTRRNRTPVASNTALATAASTGLQLVSPAP